MSNTGLAWEEQQLCDQGPCAVSSPAPHKAALVPLSALQMLHAATHISKGAKSGLAIWYPCFTML